MAKQVFDYTKHAGELETVLAKLQDPDIQIDEATKLYDLSWTSIPPSVRE